MCFIIPNNNTYPILDCQCLKTQILCLYRQSDLSGKSNQVKSATARKHAVTFSELSTYEKNDTFTVY
jgi:hypothetical protein